MRALLSLVCATSCVGLYTSWCVHRMFHVCIYGFHSAGAPLYLAAALSPCSAYGPSGICCGHHYLTDCVSNLAALMLESRRACHAVYGVRHLPASAVLYVAVCLFYYSICGPMHFIVQCAVLMHTAIMSRIWVIQYLLWVPLFSNSDSGVHTYLSAIMAVVCALSAISMA